MRTSILINNYNYQNYVIEAIDSALNQTIPADEIIVVDDCSSDQSAEILKAKSDQVHLILKDKNEGQLSAFQAGFDASTGEILLFLDADDLYTKTYIETALTFYKNHPDCDFLFTSAELFGNEERLAACYDRTRDLGFSKISTLYRRTWIGHRTSTVSIKRHVLEKIFPIPYLEDWRIRADDCLCYGASIANAHKYYLNQPLVKYRVHGNNGHYGKLKTRSQSDLEQYDQALDRLFNFWMIKFSDAENLDQFADREFRSIPQPTQQEFDTFFSIIRCAHLSKLRKAIMLVSISLYFLRHRQ
ncbi:glycosyltransferase family 2 protein [Leptolyngbya sp. NIES-2104]|uniref:glycosyltransferase family 2 protein n=1 Tax=Leptolyngbya sp. NIES-2104 TaxID=1552121 RepID=UPI0006EC9B06|nr:glycosyltransferase family 2 protein [Leptolyngbya sp. NIES-2104]GAP97623.1 glycosyl transferase [Leptolyngbya sp. NIES-2104]